MVDRETAVAGVAIAAGLLILSRGGQSDGPTGGVGSGPGLIGHALNALTGGGLTRNPSTNIIDESVPQVRIGGGLTGDPSTNALGQLAAGAFGGGNGGSGSGGSSGGGSTTPETTPESPTPIETGQDTIARIAETPERIVGGGVTGDENTNAVGQALDTINPLS